MSTERITVRRTDSGRILLLQDGRVALDLPWEAADALCRAIRQQAKTAEALSPVNVNKLVTDGAVLARLGAPFGLTNDPRIQREILHTAANSSHLGGITPQSVCGSPQLQQHPPRKEAPHA